MRQTGKQILNELGRPRFTISSSPRECAEVGQKSTAQQAFPLGNSTTGLSSDKHAPGPNGE
jgi:hypothetical protein